MQRIQPLKMWSSRPISAKNRSETTPERYKRRQLERTRRLESHRSRKEHILLSSTTARARPALSPVAYLSGSALRTSPEKSETSQDSSPVGSMNTSYNSDLSNLTYKSISERSLLQNGFRSRPTHPAVYNEASKNSPLLMKNMSSRSMVNLHHRYQSGGFRKLANPHPRSLVPDSDHKIDLAVGRLHDDKGNDIRKVHRTGSKQPLKGLPRPELVRSLSSQSIDISPPVILKIDKIDVGNDQQLPVPKTELTFPITNAVSQKKAIDLKMQERKFSPRGKIRFPRVRWGLHEQTVHNSPGPTDTLDIVKPIRRAQSLTHLANPAIRGIETDIYGINTSGGLLHTKDGLSVHRPGAAMQRSRTSTRLDLPRMALNIEIPFGGNVLLDKDETISQCSSDRHLSKINMTV